MIPWDLWFCGSNCDAAQSSHNAFMMLKLEISSSLTVLQFSKMVSLIWAFLHLWVLLYEWISSEGLELHFLRNFRSAYLRCRAGGAILHRTGSHWTGIDLIVPDIVRVLWFSCKLIRFTCVLFIQIGAQYFATEYTSAMVDVFSVEESVPQYDSVSLWIILLRVLIFAAVLVLCVL